MLGFHWWLKYSHSIIYHTWNHLSVYKQISFGSFKNVANKLLIYKWNNTRRVNMHLKSTN